MTTLITAAKETSCCGNVAFFSDSSVFSLKSSPWPKYNQYGTIFQKKKFMLCHQTFFFFDMFFIRLFLANT